MRPFNLEEAKAGKPVITRSGLPVRIVCWDRAGTVCPIIALVTMGLGVEAIHLAFTDQGSIKEDGLDDNFDLFMKPTKREGWIHVYPGPTTGPNVYPTEAKAIECSCLQPVDTIYIEWEE